MSQLNWSTGKIAAVGLAVVASTVVVTALVVGNWSSRDTAPPPMQPSQQAPRTAPTARATKPVPPRQASATQQAPAPPPVAASSPRPAMPTAADVQACNETASKATTSDKNKDVLTKAVIAGALGAGVGAAGGAIAGGGKGAGKGAAIGGIVGATAGTLYGLSESNQNDERAREAYGACMRERGYAG